MSFRIKALGIISAATIAAAGAATPIIVDFEENRLTTYRDIVGVWTGCGGITEGMGPNMRFTPEECAKKNYDEVLKFAHGVDQAITRPMTLDQHIAFTSMAYNIGLGAFKNSTLVREFNRGNIIRACLEMVYAGPDREGWTKAGGKRTAGLVYRRLEEMDRCLKGQY